MGERFIHIDSTHRDRSRFPDPCSFDVSNSLYDDNNTIDPVVSGFPHYTGTISTVTSTTNVRISITNGIIDFFKDMYFDNGYETPIKITASSESSSQTYLTLQSATISSVTDTYFIRSELPYTTTAVSAGIHTVSNVVITNTPALEVDRLWVRIIHSSTSVEIRKVRVYTGGVVTVADPFLVVPVTGSRVEFATEKENATPFIVYNTPAQHAYYNVQLLSLILPANVVVNTLKLENYPYLMVVIGTVNTGNVSNISSNNPFSSKSMFIVPNIGGVSDTWLNFNSSMIQSLRFKPGDALKIEILTPNGDVVKYSVLDNVSPLKPNPLLQMNALFSFKKINTHNK